MLTISKPLSAGQAQSYHQKEFTAKEQNYWSQRGVIAGEWQGRMSGQFGLAGMVSADDFAKLTQGHHRLRRTESSCWDDEFLKFLRDEKAGRMRDRKGNRVMPAAVKA